MQYPITKADFCIIPEFFNAPLIGLEPDQSNQTEAIRFFASFTERFKNEHVGNSP